MWQSFLSGEAGKSLTGALERAGEAITKGAERATHTSTSTTTPTPAAANASSRSKSSTSASQTTSTIDDNNNMNLSRRLQQGWGSVLEVTKQAVEKTREAVELEQSRLLLSSNSNINNTTTPRRRHVSLALDVEALRDVQVVYITDRILCMGHPALQSTVHGDLSAARKLSAVAHLLEKRHANRYMVWNLSEVEYDSNILQNQVLTFHFPGSPAPPLGLLLKLLLSMESWLRADDRNVAVVHCLTGKGRSSTVLAAFLCWMGEAGFADMNEALQYIAQCKNMPPTTTEQLIIPSQKRYATYFANMLDGVRPSQPPLMLKRVILSEAPKFAKGPPRPGTKNNNNSATDNNNNNNNNNGDSSSSRMGCAPYLQIFKGGELVFTTAATLNYHQDEDVLPFCQVADGPVSFFCETVLQGDVLIRCRHLTSRGQRVSMFRAALHTGYVPPRVMRLYKSQLDGACEDDARFPDDFFVDLIFEPCNVEMASQHLGEGGEGVADDDDEEEEHEQGDKDMDESQNEAAERRARGTVAAGAVHPEAHHHHHHHHQQQKTIVGGAKVTASAYDSMLHRDSRFWDVIAARRQEHASQRVHDHEGENEKDSGLWGPTIGRRRDFSKTIKEDDNNKHDESDKEEKKKDKSKRTDGASDANRQNSMEAKFSIGGEYDFFIPEEESASATTPPAAAANQHEEPRKRDELMEALMALDDEAISSPVSPQPTTMHPDVEEIVFDSDSVPAEPPQPTIVALPPLGVDKKQDEAATTTKKAATRSVDKSQEGEQSGSAREDAPPTQGVTVTTKAASVTSSNQVVDDVAALLEDADFLEDADVDAFLASAGDGEDDNDDEELPDDLDLDDEELEDLENFLNQASK